MIFYFLLFTIIGIIISFMIKNETNTFILFIIIAILWGVSHAPIWGLVSLGEMALGYFITKIFKNK